MSPLSRSHSISEDFNNAKQRTFARLAQWLESRIVEEMSNPKWEWTDGELRDIVDTGRLRASLQVRLTPSGITFTWPVEYAKQVHEGPVLCGSKKRLPAGRWTEAP